MKLKNMIKTAALSLAFATFSTGVFAADAQQNAIMMTPRQSCFLMRSTLEAVPTWRDNGAPLDRVLENVQQAADKTVGSTDQDKKQWLYLAKKAYSDRKFSPRVVDDHFGRRCEALPAAEGDPEFTGQAPQPTKAPEVSADDRAQKDAKMKTCIFKSHAYEMAATYRDHDYSPEEALKNMKSGFHMLDESFLKLAINNVYFDKDYYYAGGEALQMQMFNLCINGPKNWKPLK